MTTTAESRAVRVLVNVQHVLVSLLVGVLTLVVGFVVGVWSGRVGVMWVDPADYPLMEAWLIGTCVLAADAVVVTWGFLRLREADTVARRLRG